MSNTKSIFDAKDNNGGWKMVVLSEDDLRSMHYVPNADKHCHELAPRQKPDFADTFGVQIDKLAQPRSRVQFNALPIHKSKSARLRKKAGVAVGSPVVVNLGSSTYQKIVEAAKHANETRIAKRVEWKANYGVPTKRFRKGK